MSIKKIIRRLEEFIKKNIHIIMPNFMLTEGILTYI